MDHEKAYVRDERKRGWKRGGEGIGTEIEDGRARIKKERVLNCVHILILYIYKYT